MVFFYRILDFNTKRNENFIENNIYHSRMIYVNPINSNVTVGILTEQIIMKVNPADNIDVEKQVTRFKERPKTELNNKQMAKIVNKTENIADKLQKTIESSFNEKIRIKGLLKKRKETLEQFIEKFFTKWNDEHETIYVDSKETQTEPECRRSIGDIYMICKYYYPKCTLKQIKDILYDLVKNKEGYRSSYCHSTKKRMFYYSNTENNALLNTSEKDEYGMVTGDWDKI